MCIRAQTHGGRSLLHSLESVFNLVQTALWGPGRDIVVVLVAELFFLFIQGKGILISLMHASSAGVVGCLSSCPLFLVCSFVPFLYVMYVNVSSDE